MIGKKGSYDLVPKPQPEDWRDEWEPILNGGRHKIIRWLSCEGTNTYPLVAIIGRLDDDDTEQKSLISWTKSGLICDGYANHPLNLVPKKPARKLHRIGDLKSGTSIKRWPHFNDDFDDLKRGEVIVVPSPDTGLNLYFFTHEGDGYPRLNKIDQDEMVEIWDDEQEVSK